MHKIAKIGLAFCFCAATLPLAAQTIITGTDAHVQYMGRVGTNVSIAQLYWPGTSASLNFYGTSVAVNLLDSGGDNYFYVIVDGKVQSTKLHPKAGEGRYDLATNLPLGKHSVQLFKLTEWPNGSTFVLNYELSTGGYALPADAPKARKMEFYGNSITSGYAVEDTTGGDSYAPEYKNNYLAYGAVTARHYNAQYHCISLSGIGLMISAYPLIMPEMYDRLNPRDSVKKWDFTKYTPDVVVIDLFENDSWLVRSPQQPQFKIKFGDTPPTEEFIVNAYCKFVRTLRQKYPKASIICALGSMYASHPGSPWPSYIQQAVARVNDPKIFAYIFKYKNTPGHPRVNEQQNMANELEKFIDAHVKWW